MADLSGAQAALFTPSITVYGPAGATYSLGDPICYEIGVRGCRKCKRPMLLSEFYFDNEGRPRDWCKQCWNDRQRISARKRRQEDPEGVRARDNQYRQNHVEAYKEVDRRYRENHPEKMREKNRRRSEQRKAMDPEIRAAADRESNIRKLYGISPTDFDELLAAQGGVCANPACGTPHIDAKGHRLVIDHDHETGAVRGLLCNRCNRAGGMFNDDAKLLRGMAEYLES